MNDLITALKSKAYHLRVSSVRMTTQAGSGHVTSALSAADIVTALFFHVMRYDPHNPSNPDSDRFILSKGHAVPVVYAAWKELGIISDREMMTYRDITSVLEGHPTSRFDRNEVATGSLGQGLSIGIGMALSARLDSRDFRTYVLMGDSEISEGSVWEAVELAAHYRLNTVTAIVDVNRLGQAGESLFGNDLVAYKKRFEAFGWHAFTVDGHDMQALLQVFDQATAIIDKPTIILAKTRKGYGLTACEDQNGYHGKAVPLDQLDAALDTLKKRFPESLYCGGTETMPRLPRRINKAVPEMSKPESPVYTVGDYVATRVACGHTLAALGCEDPDMVVLDAEVKNSTFTELFEKNHPQRFIQSFIAEQAMIGMGVGLAVRGKHVYAGTFAAFVSRAFDQLRMAAIGRSTIKIIGSHAGVSIGQDGPSQMGLEDIAMMRTLPGSVVLYPCDAVSTQALVREMHSYDDGITYLRTTRAPTPVIYESGAKFTIGGFSMLRTSDSDVACIIAAGITIFEALKAYNELQQNGISIAVMDLYCVKPINFDGIVQAAHRANKTIITVEDHYYEGGIGESVAAGLASADCTIRSLAVTKLPRSGSTDALMEYEQISAAAIVQELKLLV